MRCLYAVISISASDERHMANKPEHDFLISRDTLRRVSLDMHKNAAAFDKIKVLKVRMYCMPFLQESCLYLVLIVR